MRYLLLLFLAGCASSAPRQYAQGIPIAPSAPTFDPIFEAPTNTGHPGYVGPVENLPRSPHGRVLPETPDTRREPGLWAGDQPRASQRPPWADAPTTVHGVDLVLLPERDDEAYRDRVKHCAYMIAGVTAIGTVDSMLTRLSDEEVKCIIARLNAYCAWKDSNFLERRIASGGASTPAFQRLVRDNLVVSNEYAAQMCAYVKRSVFDPVVAHAVGQWDMLARSANVRQ